MGPLELPSSSRAWLPTTRTRRHGVSPPRSWPRP